MKKYRIFNFYRRFDKLFPSAGDTNYGNHLAYPGLYLEEKLKKFDIYYTIENDFDIAVFADLDIEMFHFAKQLPHHITKILLLVETPVYCPFPHHPEIQTDNVWNAVISYNREIYFKKIIYYDIAVTGTQMPIPELMDIKNCSPNGVFIGSCKAGDLRGYGAQRDAFISELAALHEISIFGGNWPPLKNYAGVTSNKVKTISDFTFSVVAENAKYSGYVTEKIADSILAERPVLYFGDSEHAHRRFGDTFIILSKLSLESYYLAKHKLLNNYDLLYKNCLLEKSKSHLWCESFIQAMLSAML